MTASTKRGGIDLPPPSHQVGHPWTQTPGTTYGLAVRLTASKSPPSTHQPTKSAASTPAPTTTHHQTNLYTDTGIVGSGVASSLKSNNYNVFRLKILEWDSKFSSP